MPSSDPYTLLGKPVRAVSGLTGEAYAEGLVIGVNDQPTVIIQAPTGDRVAWVARLTERLPEAPAGKYVWPRHERRRPCRGDDVEAWIKASRDLPEYGGPDGGSESWRALDALLDEYRLHADTGTPLDEHAHDGPHCDCPGEQNAEDRA